MGNGNKSIFKQHFLDGFLHSRQFFFNNIKNYRLVYIGIFMRNKVSHIVCRNPVLIRKRYLSPLIIKRFLQNRSPLTSMLISSDQHINMLRPREYFPPSRRVLRWSPSAAALGHQKRAYTERGNTIAKSRLASIRTMSFAFVR